MSILISIFLIRNIRNAKYQKIKPTIEPMLIATAQYTAGISFPYVLLKRDWNSNKPVIESLARVIQIHCNVRVLVKSEQNSAFRP